jgi:hypothetical protein
MSVYYAVQHNCRTSNFLHSCLQDYTIEYHPHWKVPFLQPIYIKFIYQCNALPYTVTLRKVNGLYHTRSSQEEEHFFHYTLFLKHARTRQCETNDKYKREGKMLPKTDQILLMEQYNCLTSQPDTNNMVPFCSSSQSCRFILVRIT